MKPWENGKLKVAGNKRYLSNGDTPFFWLGDTAWLIFSNITEEEAYLYLKNRAEKGFNVIQAVLIYSTEELQDVNKMNVKEVNYREEEYWVHCDRVIQMAEELGMYVALLPTWGSLVKKGVLNENNALRTEIIPLCSFMMELAAVLPTVQRIIGRSPYITRVQHKWDF